MKAIIVKDNDFQTIGFEVTSKAENGLRGETILFSWGISSTLKSNFQKEVNVNNWLVQIFDLVKLKGVLQEQEEGVREFFSVAGKNKLIKDGQGVDVNDYKQRVEITKMKIEKIVKSIN